MTRIVKPGILILTQIAVIFVIISLKGVRSSLTEYFVSSEIGVDQSDCGTITKQCRTIHFAYHRMRQQQGEEDVRIMLDGGMKNSLTYTLTSPLFIANRLELWKNENTLHNPVLKANYHDAYAFSSASKDTNNALMVSSVDFNNLKIFQALNKTNSKITITIHNSTTMFSSFHMPNNTPLINIKSNNEVLLNLSQSSFFSYAEVLSIKSSRRSLINVDVQECNFQNVSGLLKIHKIINEITIPTDNLNKSLNIGNTAITHNQTDKNKANKIKITNCKIQGTLLNSAQLKQSLISIDTNFDALSTLDVEISNISFYNCHLPENGVIRLSDASSVTLKNVMITRLHAKEIIKISRSARVRVSGFYVKESIIYTNMLSLHECTHIDFNMLSFSNNIYESSGFDFLQCSNVTINNITVERNLCGSTNQNVTFWSATAVRNFTVNNLNLFENTFSITMVSFIKSTDVTFHNIHDARNVFNADGFFMNSVYNNELHNIISQHSTIGRTFIHLVNSKGVIIKDIRIHNLTSNKHFVMAQYVIEFTVQRVEVYESKIEESIISLLECSLNIKNMNVTSNKLNGRVLIFLLSNVMVRNVFISYNQYHTGISLTNCNATISDMTMKLNNATGSTRDLYYSEYNDQKWDPEKVGQYLCWGFLVRKLTLINISITTRTDTLDLKNYYSVSFFLIVPKVTMKNFQLNLEKFQNNGFEMIINNRDYRYIFPDLKLNCPVGTFAEQDYDNTDEMTYKYQARCKPCDANSYTTESGQMHVTGITTKELESDPVEDIDKIVIDKFVALINNPECKVCSVGGVCRHGLTKGRGNFHGYIEEKTKNVIYLSCPSHYCCTSRDNVNCTTYNTCYKRREGVLCGNCQAGYQVNMFNSFCIPSNVCTRISEFWVLYVVTVFIVFLVICFIDQLGPILKKLLSLFKKALRKRKSKRQHLNKTFIIEYDNFNLKNLNVSISTIEATTDSTTNLKLDAPDQASQTETTEFSLIDEIVNDEIVNDETVNDNSTDFGLKSDIKTTDTTLTTKSGRDNERYLNDEKELSISSNEDNSNSSLDVTEEKNLVGNSSTAENQIKENSFYLQQQRNIQQPSDKQLDNKISQKSDRTQATSSTQSFIIDDSEETLDCDVMSTVEDEKQSEMGKNTLINNGKQYTIGGVFQAFVAFYQVRSLMNVESIRKNAFTEFMSDVFNGGLFFNFAATFCPYLNLGVADKMFIRYVGFSIFMLSILLIMSIVYYLYNYIFPAPVTARVENEASSIQNNGELEVKDQNPTTGMEEGTKVTNTPPPSPTIINDENENSEVKTSLPTTVQISTDQPSEEETASPIKDTEATSTPMPKQTSYSPPSLSFKHRLEVCYSKILLFNFKNLAFFCFLAIHCVSINEFSVWYSNGNIQCLQSWQYGAILFLVLWVVPFPVALAVSFHLYQHEKITYHEKMICMTFPMATIWFCVRSGDKKVKIDRLQLEFVQQMYVEPFRLSQGETDKYIFWDHWRLIQRLILSTLSVFLPDPIFKVTSMIPCIIFFAAVYVFVQPFKKQFSLLHWLEISSLLGYFVIIAYNLFKSFIFVFDVTDTREIDLLIRVFMFFEVAFSPLVICVIFMIGNYVYGMCAKGKKQKVK